MNSLIKSSTKSEEHRVMSSPYAKHARGWSQTQSKRIERQYSCRTRREMYSGFIVSRKWALRTIFCQFRLPRTEILLFQLDFNKIVQVYAPKRSVKIVRFKNSTMNSNQVLASDPQIRCEGRLQC